jgi:hypothetical protein
MRLSPLVAAGSIALLLVACTDARDTLAPSSPALDAMPAQQVQATGHFDALVDFATLTLTPRGQNCLLDVRGALVFTGTLEGTATGHTQALVSATCEEVAAGLQTGTFYPDVFKSELAFTGTVNGEPVEATGWYMGRSQPGGAIDGRLVLHGDVRGELDVDARIAVGGEYGGTLVVH